VSRHLLKATIPSSLAVLYSEWRVAIPPTIAHRTETTIPVVSQPLRWRFILDLEFTSRSFVLLRTGILYRVLRGPFRDLETY
jgi:hypothetical protein